LVLSLAEIELPCLTVVVGEALGTDTALFSGFSNCSAMKALYRTLARRVLGQGVGLIGNTALRLLHLHVAVTLLVGEWAFGGVDRDLVKIGRPEARELRVLIGEQSTLQQRIVREIDAGNDMGRTVSNLFRFGKEIVWPAIQHHPANHFQRHELFGNKLCSVQMIEGKFVCFFLRE